MRLIDADALAMHLADWQLSCGEEERDVIEEAIRAIDESPTIDAVPATIEGALGYLHKVGWIQEHDRIMTEDVAPVRHGHWIYDCCDIVCSECGTRYNDELCYMLRSDCSYNEPRYCPWCGARMDAKK